MLLHRINSEKNEARFYLVEAAPSLLDPFAVLRMWGRIGGHQRGMITPCASAEEAERLAEQLIRRKLKRGYKVEGEKDGQQEKTERSPTDIPQTKNHPAQAGLSPLQKGFLNPD